MTYISKKKLFVILELACETSDVKSIAHLSGDNDSLFYLRLMSVAILVEHLLIPYGYICDLFLIDENTLKERLFAHDLLYYGSKPYRQKYDGLIMSIKDQENAKQ